MGPGLGAPAAAERATTRATRRRGFALGSPSSRSAGGDRTCGHALAVLAPRFPAHRSEERWKVLTAH